MTSAAVPTLSIHGLHFGYRECAVFDNFSLETSAKIVILEGPSGCGKTTLLKLLAGVLAPSKIKAFVRREPASLILQEDALFPWLTVEENLACVPGWNGFDNCPPAVNTLLPLVKPIALKRAFSLSFGQRRITELLRVLCFPSPLICLDEPFNFLDGPKRATVAGVIENMSEGGVHFLISTHYREDLRFRSGVTYKFEGSLPLQRLEQAA
jgi:ABC-type multidrug transport system ATPase subunit